ncbi:YwbE family protein [Pseudalkalibacillus salsuginis]|uniref:YwbE family protein n=1 Tax=Pseudalkalibacillus salsuginis TaxID=2910972 RepID=UPI001F393CA6|nr:YwbE family protein [Pseudalkalibacillus salsuginis]MCF6411295.1 YwbE family protein [Pseudalkalibacillus salsuginis]
MNGQNRVNIQPGVEVDIVLKKDQRTGKLTRGIVKDILTKSSSHPHGIKVRLQDGQVGRVKEVFKKES